jgi:3-hydroxyisobutyrate dehydrogenase-like beta-hydroxyacid dehydrogenase
VLFLLDEMFPPGTCRQLADRGHDAVHVRDRGVDARPDREAAAVAARESRVLVTENVKDFADERDLVIVCVLKSRLPASGMAEHLAALLAAWAAADPDPYVGLHWPGDPG